jgi:hypothetical protein
MPHFANQVNRAASAKGCLRHYGTLSAMFPDQPGVGATTPRLLCESTSRVILKARSTSRWTIRLLISVAPDEYLKRVA